MPGYGKGSWLSGWLRIGLALLGLIFGEIEGQETGIKKMKVAFFRASRLGIRQSGKRLCVSEDKFYFRLEDQFPLVIAQVCVL
jgi:hypothetical protein